MYEERFITEMDIQNNIESIFQSDCANYHLHENYNFDILWNQYKYYLPNLVRHFGYVDGLSLQRNWIQRETPVKNKETTIKKIEKEIIKKIHIKRH